MEFFSWGIDKASIDDLAHTYAEVKEGRWQARNKFGFKADFFIFARKMPVFTFPADHQKSHFREFEGLFAARSR
jgi:hypothetical protein